MYIACNHVSTYPGGNSPHYQIAPKAKTRINSNTNYRLSEVLITQFT